MRVLKTPGVGTTHHTPNPDGTYGQSPISQILKNLSELNIYNRMKLKIIVLGRKKPRGKRMKAIIRDARRYERGEVRLCMRGGKYYAMETPPSLSSARKTPFPENVARASRQFLGAVHRHLPESPSA